MTATLSHLPVQSIDSVDVAILGERGHKLLGPGLDWREPVLLCSIRYCVTLDRGATHTHLCQDLFCRTQILL